jgi:hypothetical protein
MSRYWRFFVHQTFVILAEIDPVPGPTFSIDPSEIIVFEYSPDTDVINGAVSPRKKSSHMAFNLSDRLICSIVASVRI